MTKPRVTVLALGGTIAMTRSDQGGVVPTLTGDMLVAAVPALTEVAAVDARSFRQLPGAHLGFDDLEALAAAVEEAVAGGAHGVVVTQGTDTIEETAFALDRLLGIEAPVVVTGAMRNPTVPGADGPANLLAAVQVAASEAARGLGCLVVLNDEIHAARFLRKTHTSSPAAFTSPSAGPIGWVGEGRVRLVARVERVPVVPQSREAGEARVALVTVGLGDDGALIDAARQAGFDGMVVEATGGGHVAPAVADALERAAAAMPVVLASRTGAGEILARTYGFPGGEIDLQRRGLIRAGWLDGLKAKVLLTLLLRRGQGGRDNVSAAFRPWGGGAGS
ncbi:asparaginase [Azospirillum brasilense]|uniref:asparaginase n=1 Tax=Azospirillum brasilense TaxID=192 RepID=UPI000E09F857|nr:asparaginase [Azospirillum brasilense]